MHKKYDLIFSLGFNCPVAAYLNELRLRTMSGPFDWLTDCDFHERIRLLANNFKDFLNIDYLKITGQNPVNKMAIVKNRKLNITFHHDFSFEMSLEKNLEIVKEKYNRRIARLFDFLNDKNKKLLGVYIDLPTDKATSNKKLMNISKLALKFNSHFDILYVKHCDKLKTMEFEIEKFQSNLSIAHINNTTPPPREYWEGNKENIFALYRHLNLQVENIEKEILDFAKKHKLYIYGTGAIAWEWLKRLLANNIPFAGFCVSDGQSKPINLPWKVYYLSEIKEKDTGFVLAMNSTAKEQVLLNLKGTKFKIFDV